MNETTSAPSLRELSEAIARTIYDTGNKTIATALWEGWTPAPLEEDDRTYRLHLDYAATLLAGPLAGRLIDPTTQSEAVAAARAEGVREGLERAASEDAPEYIRAAHDAYLTARDAYDGSEPAWLTLSSAADRYGRLCRNWFEARLPAPPTLSPGGRTDG